MHELSIAKQILDTALAAAAENGAPAVEGVIVEIGAMRMVVPETLETAFSFAAEGTPAEGARLETVQVALRAECRGCKLPYEPRMDNFLCPRCGTCDVEIVEGNDIVLRSVRCRTREGVRSNED